MEMAFERGARGSVVVKPRGRLDALEAPVFESTLAPRVDDGDVRLVVDFSLVDYISSAGLRSLLSLVRMTRARDGGVAVCSLTGVVREVFEISGFQSFLPVAETVADAEKTLFSEGNSPA